jgi:hypothetical protein
MKKFSLLGGKDLAKVVSTIMKQLMDDLLAQKFSWKGYKGKMPFYQLKVKEIIVGKSLT